jgi:DNA-binding CsgD family transcriptional regulator
MSEHRHVDVAIVGAGFGGLGAAICVKRAGFGDFLVFEKADDVGGTWRDNSYPGCACDVPSHLYSYSFARNPNWSASRHRRPGLLPVRRDPICEGPAGVGYLLKDRVADVGEFVDALARIGAGGTALDPEVVRLLLGTSRRGASLDAALTPREGEVLSLMAEGRSNAGIAGRLVISEGAVEKHIANIFAKLGLSVSGSDNRRVLAVLRYLQS